MSYLCLVLILVLTEKPSLGQGESSLPCCPCSTTTFSTVTTTMDQTISFFDAFTTSTSIKTTSPPSTSSTALTSPTATSTTPTSTASISSTTLTSLTATSTTPPSSTSTSPATTTSEPVSSTTPPPTTSTQPAPTTSPPVSSTSTSPPVTSTTPPSTTSTPPGTSTTPPSTTSTPPGTSTTPPPTSSTSPETSTLPPSTTSTSPEISTTPPSTTSTSPEISTTTPFTTSTPPVTSTTPPPTSSTLPVTTTSPTVITTTPPPSTSSTPAATTSPPITTTVKPTTTPPVCPPDYIFVPEEGVFFKKVTDLEVTYFEARDLCRLDGSYFFFPNPDIPGGATGRNLLRAGVLPSTDREEVGSKYIGLWTTAIFRTALNIFWNPFDKKEIEIPTALVDNNVENGTNYGILLKWNNDFFQRKYRTFDMNSLALFTCVCDPNPPTPSPTTTPKATTFIETTSTESPCPPDYIFVDEEGAFFKKVTDLQVNYFEARDLCRLDGAYYFIPNPDIPGGRTGRNLLMAGVLPSTDREEVGSSYIGLWTTALFRTAVNIFWHPFEKREVQIPTAEVLNAENGTNYGMILKWNNDFFQRKYRTFDMESLALYTCVCFPPTASPPPTTTQPPPPTTIPTTTESPCPSDYIFVEDEGVFFKKSTGLEVSYKEARDLCRADNTNYFIPNSDIGGGATGKNLLDAGVLPSTDRTEVGADYIGLWTTAIFRTRKNDFWDPIGKRTIQVQNPTVGNDIQNGTNYGLILKWNNQFFQRKYRTFDMDAQALFTCICDPSLEPLKTN